MTHISHAFLPYDPEDHRGVYFPTGLQLLNGAAAPSDSPLASSSGGSGKSLLVTYGKDDNRVMMMRLGEEALREYLEPLDDLDPKRYG